MTGQRWEEPVAQPSHTNNPRDWSKIEFCPYCRQTGNNRLKWHNDIALLHGDLWTDIFDDVFGSRSVCSIAPANNNDGLTLRQAALIAGIAYLLMPVTYAEFSIFPKLVIPGRIDQTVQNIVAHNTLFAVAILCYLITFLEDVIIAWALYVLLAPVNRSVSLLSAWFRLVYTVMGLYAWLNLVTVYRLVTTPDFLTAFGSGPLHAQVLLQLRSFRYDWNVSLGIFGIHLVLLGCLIYRSGYIPKVLGVLLAIDGVGWAINSLRPYLYPNAHLGFFVTFSFVELLLPLWLLIRGWKIKEPTRHS